MRIFLAILAAFMVSPAFAQAPTPEEAPPPVKALHQMLFTCVDREAVANIHFVVARDALAALQTQLDRANKQVETLTKERNELKTR